MTNTTIDFINGDDDVEEGQINSNKFFLFRINLDPN